MIDRRVVFTTNPLLARWGFPELKESDTLEMLVYALAALVRVQAGGGVSDDAVIELNAALDERGRANAA